MAIDPAILRFGLAILVLSIVIEIVGSVSKSAAWALVVLLIVGVLIDNPLLIGFINLGSKQLQGSLK